MTKTAAAGPVLAGNTIAYTITVANAGPSDAQTVATDRRRAGQHDLRLRRPDLGTGVHSHQPRRGRHGHDHRHDRHAGPRRLGELHRGRPGVAEHAGRNDDHQHGRRDRRHQRSQPRQQQPTVTTDVATQADVSVTKTAAAGPVVAGDTITYTITVANAGPSDAQTVALTDLVPANTTFVSDAQTSGPAFTLTSPAVGGTGTITGTIATLASGASASFTVVVLVSPGTPDGTTITNTADVTAATIDPNLANNSQTVTTAVRDRGGPIGDEDGRGRPRARGQRHRLHDHGRERRPRATPRPWR